MILSKSQVEDILVELHVFKDPHYEKEMIRIHEEMEDQSTNRKVFGTISEQQAEEADRGNMLYEAMSSARIDEQNELQSFHEQFGCITQFYFPTKCPSCGDIAYTSINKRSISLLGFNGTPSVCRKCGKYFIGISHLATDDEAKEAIEAQKTSLKQKCAKPKVDMRLAGASGRKLENKRVSTGSCNIGASIYETKTDESKTILANKEYDLFFSLAGKRKRGAFFGVGLLIFILTRIMLATIQVAKLTYESSLTCATIIILLSYWLWICNISKRSHDAGISPTSWIFTWSTGELCGIAAGIYMIYAQSTGDYMQLHLARQYDAVSQLISYIIYIVVIVSLLCLPSKQNLLSKPKRENQSAIVPCIASENNDKLKGAEWSPGLVPQDVYHRQLGSGDLGRGQGNKDVRSCSTQHLAEKVQHNRVERTPAGEGKSRRGFGLWAILAIPILIAATYLAVQTYETMRIARNTQIEKKKATEVQTSFWKGVADGNLNIVDKALRDGADVNEIRDEGISGTSALGISVVNGNIDMVNMLLRNGADVNMRTSKFPNLWCAITEYNGDNCTREQLIIRLCNAGLNPNLPIVRKISDAERQTLLAYCNQETQKRLKDIGQEGLDENSAKNTISNYYQNAMATDEMRFSVLRYAVAHNLRDAVRVLIDKGANPNGSPKDTSIFTSPIYEATKNRNFEIVKLLVENGANANWQDSVTGTSALITAIGLPSDKCDPEIVRYLLKHGANCFQKNLQGMSCIHFAAASGQITVIEMFIEQGESVNKLTDNSNCTPLRSAIQFNQHECAKWLIEHGANLNIEDCEHITDAMYIVIKAEEDPMWMYLLDESQTARAVNDIEEWQKKYSHLYQNK